MLLWLLAAGTGALDHVRLESVSHAVWGALAFLIVASTLIGYAAFVWINRSVSSTLANTYSYVAPVIAISLSAAFFGEPVGWGKVAAAGVALVGVALMVTGSTVPASSTKTSGARE